MGVPVAPAWLCCSESGEEVRGDEDDGADVSTEEELEVGGAVPAVDDPEEEEEVDLEMGVTAAAAGLAATSGGSAPTDLSGAPDSWLGFPVGAATSGRTAVPESNTTDSKVKMKKRFILFK